MTTQTMAIIFLCIYAVIMLVIGIMSVKKTQTMNEADLNQLQLTIENLKYQNTSLGEKIVSEKQVNGLFGWFLRLFNR